MRTLIPCFIVTMLIASAYGQTPPLDGAEVRVEQGGRTVRYRLVPIDVPATNPTTRPSTSPPGPPETSADGLSVLMPSTTAPATVFAHALALPQKLDPMTTTYAWDFGDPAAKRNTLPGFNVAHVYDTPGEYTLTLTATPATGAPVIVKRKITVSPDARPVLHVASTGDDRNDASADAPVRSLERAAQLSVTNVTGARIVLRRGDVFDVPRTALSPGSNVYLGAYGDPAKPQPVLRYTGAGNAEPIVRCDAKTSGLTIENITFDSAAGEAPNATQLPHCIVAAGRQITVRRCTFLNVSYCINGNGKPEGVLIANCEAPLVGGVRGYLAWIEGSDWVVLDNKHANSTREHGVRAWGYSRLLVAGNDIANLARPGVDPVDIEKNTINLQAGTYAYVWGNTLRGPSSMGPLGKADGLKHKDQRSRFYRVENNHFILRPLGVQHGLSDVLIRGNRFDVDDDQCLEIDGYDAQFGRGLANVTIASNVGANHGVDGGFLFVGGAIDGITLTGNRYLAPRLEPGANHTAAVFVCGRDLSSFRRIENNTWPAGRPKKYAEGGAMYVWPSWSDPRGYLDEKEWAACPQVRGDRFEKSD
jgi:hypothetical protein